MEPVFILARGQGRLCGAMPMRRRTGILRVERGFERARLAREAAASAYEAVLPTVIRSRRAGETVPVSAAGRARERAVVGA